VSSPTRSGPATRGPTGARRSTVAVASPPVAGARPPASAATEYLLRRMGPRTGCERDNLELRLEIGDEKSALFLGCVSRSKDVTDFNASLSLF